MKIKNKQASARIMIVLSLVIFAAFSVSGNGLDKFVSIEDSITIQEPSLDISFEQSGLSWLSSSGDTINISRKDSYNYSFSEPKSWYDLNLSLYLSLEDSNKLENITGFTFKATDTNNNSLDSCSSSIDTMGHIECNSLISTNQKIKTLTMTFQKDNIKTLRLSGDSRIELEAAN